jgi:hypothetical protein
VRCKAVKLPQREGQSEKESLEFSMGQAVRCEYVAGGVKEQWCAKIEAFAVHGGCEELGELPVVWVKLGVFYSTADKCAHMPTMRVVTYEAEPHGEQWWWPMGVIQSHAHVVHFCQRHAGQSVLHPFGPQGVLDACPAGPGGVTHSDHPYYLLNRFYAHSLSAYGWADGELYWCFILFTLVNFLF